MLKSKAQIAKELGVTKDQVAGYIRSKKWVADAHDKRTQLFSDEKFKVIQSHFGTRDREHVLNVMEETTGGRLIQNYYRIGGLQAMADNTKLPVYVSKLAADDPNFGKSNNDKVFKGANATDPIDGTLPPPD